MVRVCASFLLLSVSAWAQKRPPEPVGVKPLAHLHADKGYFDEAFALDGAGGRLAYVNDDGAAFAEVTVVDLNQGGKAVAHFDVTAWATTVARLAFVLDGNALLLVAPASPKDAAKKSAFLVDLGGKLLHKWGPATDFVVGEIEGAETITVFDAKAAADGATTFDVGFYRLDSGKPVGKRQRLVANAEGFVKSIDLRILYWRDAYQEIVGKKPGTYDKFKDQRMNDSEGIYDVVAGKLLRSTAIPDLILHAKLTLLRAERPNQSAFAWVTPDLHGIDLLTAEDQRTTVSMDEPFAHYETGSLAQELGRDGKLAFSLTIDPVNPDAVARQVADPELVDLYSLDPSTGKAVRRARLPKLGRAFTWRLSSGRWAVLRRHKGFSRGGPDLEVYDLVSP